MLTKVTNSDDSINKIKIKNLINKKTILYIFVTIYC